jgi:NO-binding membrane sensor protein with MHYT domain
MLATAGGRGGGIETVHYVGMQAMRLPAMCVYSHGIVVLSVVLGVIISFAATRFYRVEVIALVSVAARTTTFRLLGSVMVATVLVVFKANLYSYR